MAVAFVDKMRRLASLAGIVGLSLGSMLVAACGGKTSTDGHTDTPDDVQEEDAAADVMADTQTDEPEDVPEEDPDTDLWDVIAE